MEGQQAFEEWKTESMRKGENARQDFANTDEAFKLYNQTHSPLSPNKQSSQIIIDQVVIRNLVKGLM